MRLVPRRWLQARAQLCDEREIFSNRSRHAGLSNGISSKCQVSTPDPFSAISRPAPFHDPASIFSPAFVPCSSMWYGLFMESTPSRSVRVFHSFEEAEASEQDYWLSLTPEQRLDAVGECVREYLALRNEPEQRLHRVYRVCSRQEG